MFVEVAKRPISASSVDLGCSLVQNVAAIIEIPKRKLRFYLVRSLQLTAAVSYNHLDTHILGYTYHNAALILREKQEFGTSCRNLYT